MTTSTDTRQPSSYHVRELIPGALYRVDGGTKPYVVSLRKSGAVECSCPSNTTWRPGVQCKHSKLVISFVRFAEELNADLDAGARGEEPETPAARLERLNEEMFA